MDDRLTPELWRRAEPILEKVLDLPDDERDAYLDEACGDDRELRAALDRLVEADAGQSGEFLESLAAAVPRIVSLPAEVPKRIGDYWVERVLGEGGMGIVYLAEQTEPLKRHVAVKVLKLGMDTAQVVARFAAERQALAVMDHASIARVFDAGATEDGRPYFVMEYVEGVPITEYCDREGLAIDERLRLMASVCDAIQHAHYKGVIHRDIKPSNVLVRETDGRPVPKVIDFGIAKAIDQRLTERTLFTEHGQLVGTPAYMSPEQAGGADRDIDTRTDVYSLGVLLYELLAGSLPFDPEELRRKGYDEIQRIIRETDPPRPSARLRTATGDGGSETASRRGIEGELDWVVMKAIEKSRDRRYDTPSELQLDLERFLSNEPVQARPTSTAYRFRKFVRRHRVAVVSACVVAVALLVGVGGLAWGLVEAREQRAEAERQTAIAQAVNDFLNDDLLAGANPQKGGGRHVTLLELVDRAAELVDERFPDQPRVQADIRKTLATTYFGLGEYEASERQLLQAVDLVDSLFGRKSLQSISTRLDLGAAYAQRAQYDAAEPLFEEALEDSRDTHGPEHQTTLTCMNNLAFVYDQRGRYEDSLPIHEQVFDIRKRTLGDKHQHTLISMNNVAYVYYQLGRIDEAEEMFFRRAELCPEVYGPTHPETVNATVTVATLYGKQGKYDEVERVLIELLDRTEPVLGGGHPLILRAKERLGGNYYDKGDYRSAEPLIRESLEATREKLGFVHPQTLEVAHSFSELLCKLGRDDEAVASFTETLAGFRELSPQGSRETAVALKSYGECLTGLERYDVAEEPLLEAVSMWETIAGASDPGIAKVASKLVELYEGWGRPDDAAAWKTRAE